MIDNIEKTTRAVLLGLIDQDQDEEALDELKLLASTAGAIVLGRVVQKKNKIDPAYYVGLGKAKEIAQAVKTLDANAVICDDELSPVQIRNLENLINAQIIDRTMLILDIFAGRAKTLEGKVQVKLAQLQYLLPRLTGKGIELSQEGGGIGTRGPGETKLETDRRHIRRSIYRLKKELKDIQRSRQVITDSRSHPVISLVGYTNAGKSTLMRALTKADVATGDRLFETLDTTTRGLELPDGRKVLLSDTVGFIKKLPHHLVEAFKSTLEEVKEAELLIHVVDGSSQEMEQEIHTVNEVLESLGVKDKPTIICLNKIDKADPLNTVGIKNDDNVVRISALEKMNLDLLLEKITLLLPSRRKNATLVIPFEDGKALSMIYEDGLVEKEEYISEGILIKGDIGIITLNKLEKYVLKIDTHREF